VFLDRLRDDASQHNDAQRRAGFVPGRLAGKATSGRDSGATVVPISRIALLDWRSTSPLGRPSAGASVSPASRSCLASVAGLPSNGFWPSDAEAPFEHKTQLVASRSIEMQRVATAPSPATRRLRRAGGPDAIKQWLGESRMVLARLKEQLRETVGDANDVCSVCFDRGAIRHGLAINGAADSGPPLSGSSGPVARHYLLLRQVLRAASALAHAETGASRSVTTLSGCSTQFGDATTSGDRDRDRDRDSRGAMMDNDAEGML